MYGKLLRTNASGVKWWHLLSRTRKMVVLTMTHTHAHIFTYTHTRTHAHTLNGRILSPECVSVGNSLSEHSQRGGSMETRHYNQTNPAGGAGLA